MFYRNSVNIPACEKYSQFTFEEISENELQDISYTLSYYPEIDAWVSYHSYIPSGIFATRENIISFDNKNVYVHNQNNYGLYYNGQIHSSKITPVFKSKYKTESELLAATFSKLSLSCDILESKNVNRDKIISTLAFYNSYQSTNRINLIPFIRGNGFSNQYDIANIRLVKNYWNFNMFRDLKINKKALTWEEWTKLEEAIFNNDINEIGIPDLTFADNIESNKRFSDEYLIAELCHNNLEQNQFLLYDIDVNTIMK
jgi:hypothetical protein